MSEYLFTSESVSAGHPDKFADQVSDAVVDAALRAAGNEVAAVRCAVETLVKGDLLVIAGEITTPGELPDPFALARQVAQDIGYTDPAFGFSVENCREVNGLTEQSTDIAQGVGVEVAEGAGDQGLMFGYACRETEVLMPLPITLAHRLVHKQAELLHSGQDWLRPDAKSQVTVRYVDGEPQEITAVVISTQHAEEIDGQDYTKVLEEKVIEEIAKPILHQAHIDFANCQYLINPSGKFITGGPQADTGLTGRKIIVDTYGGAAPHGGGAFSGKDPSKVDRSASYAARYIAKNLVAAGLAQRCQVQVSYAIGYAKPVSLMVTTFGTGTQSDEHLANLVMEKVDLSPRGIIDGLALLRPIYQPTAVYGHFGRDDIDLPWEDTSKAHELFG